MTRIMRKVNRGKQVGKKRCEEGKNGVKEGGRSGCHAGKRMKGRDKDQGSQKTQRVGGRKGGTEGRKKGWADSYFSTVATRVGCNPNPIVTTHIVNSHSHTLEDWPRPEFRESSPAPARTFLSACLHVTLSV